MPAVRPTKRALSDLGVPVPNVGVELSSVDNEQIQQAQRTPIVVAAGGGKRIVELVDRVWWKHKFKELRGAVVELQPAEVHSDVADPEINGRWWMGAFGERRADSPQADFYAQLTAECERAASGSAAPTSTAHLLPADWDWKRLVAERSFAVVQGMRRMISDAIAQSLKAGHSVSLEAGDHIITVTVRQPKGDEAYLVVRTYGVPNAKDLALILGSVPGVAADDWMPADSDDLDDLPEDFSPEPGQIVWATYLPEGSRNEILSISSGVMDAKYQL